MGKTDGSSWFTAVKNVFRSPEKLIPRRINRRQDNDLVEEVEDELHQRPVYFTLNYLFFLIFINSYYIKYISIYM